MVTSDLNDTFRATRNTLEAHGVESDQFQDLLAARLVVERVGEQDNLGWWNSLALSETGRERLSEVTPKTVGAAQLELADSVGKKVEADCLPVDAVSLYSFGPRIETRLENALDRIETNNTLHFSELETLSVSSVDESWTEPIIAELKSTKQSGLDPSSFPIPNPDGSMELSEGGYTETKVENEFYSLLITFLRGYGTGTTEPRIPYYPLHADR